MSKRFAPNSCEPCGEHLFFGAHTAIYSAHTKQALRGNVVCNKSNNERKLKLLLIAISPIKNIVTKGICLEELKPPKRSKVEKTGF